jgi:non-ribosomal peptide synthetase component F
MVRPDNFDDLGFGVLFLGNVAARVEFGSLEVESVPLPYRGATRDLAFYVQEHDGVIYGVIEYDAGLFEPATIERMADEYRAVLRAAVTAPDTPIDAIVVAMREPIVLVGE